jgi:hypothetical protein
MLRKIYIYALQVDAGRRPKWITPCKRSAARGRDVMHRVSTACEMSSCGLKSRISITAGHRPAESTRTPHDCLEGRTSNARRVETGHALSLHDCLAASRGRQPIRGSMTRGYENQALRATHRRGEPACSPACLRIRPHFDIMQNGALRNIS